MLGFEFLLQSESIPQLQLCLVLEFAFESQSVLLLVGVHVPGQVDFDPFTCL